MVGVVCVCCGSALCLTAGVQTTTFQTINAAWAEIEAGSVESYVCAGGNAIKSCNTARVNGGMSRVVDYYVSFQVVACMAACCCCNVVRGHQKRKKKKKKEEKGTTPLHHLSQ